MVGFRQPRASGSGLFAVRFNLVVGLLYVPAHGLLGIFSYLLSFRIGLIAFTAR